MDETLHGTRDPRGHWKPSARIAYPAVFVWPLQPIEILKWLFGWSGYLLPFNLLYAAVAVVCWMWLTPSLETMRTLTPGWIALVFLRNFGLTVLFFGAFHVTLYTRKAQGGAYKYNARWLDENSTRFLFRSQLLDNMTWTLASGVTFWTAYEVVTLWVFANGIVPFVSWEAHPVYCVLLMLLIPLFREVHFYAVHRLIHWPPLYRVVHRLHHNNVNPGPWSGLAMHPLEHLLYFSGVLIHWVVPSHPLHALFHLLHAGISPVPSHSGFDRVLLGKRAIPMEGYAHYLHHKFFECNYADGAIPLDRWFGTFHDGTDEAHVAMNRRVMARNAGRRSRAA
jgi:sterol desaturase/sphingolipid hydroxylase (fatty acid hydroxylase superfamily)